MKTIRLWLLALVVLACNSAPPAPATGDAAPPPESSTSIPDWAKPPPPFTPTPMPSWLVNPRPPLGNVKAAGTRPPIIPASWTVPAWFIDPANSSGVASDNNTCTTSGAPCLTYAEVAARWGTYAPRLRQTTTITWMSNQSGTTDPVYQAPYLENGGSLINSCTPVQVASVSIGTVTAKNRNTPQLLQADLGASGAVNQLLINSTHASHAWSYKVVSGTVFSISQPLAVFPALPAAMPFPVTEVDSWTNNDTVTLNTLTAVNFASVLPQVTDNGSNTPGVYISQCNIFDPGTNDPFYVNGNVRMIDVLLNRELVTLESGEWNIFGSYFYNPNDRANLFKTAVGAAWDAVGGIFAGTSVALNATDIDCDTIINTNLAISGNSNPSTGNTGPGTVYIESTKALTVSSGRTFIVTSNGCVTSAVMWGPGGFTVSAPGHAVLSTAGGATGTSVFVLTGGIKLGTSTTGCSHTGAAPDVINCGINITGANFDAAAGVAGFGSNAFIPGGASIGGLAL